MQHFAAVRAGLDATGVRYTLVPTLVRGLDYYSRTTFEFIGPTENQNSTITGGGRYDYLIEEIGGPPTPGIGFGGIERLLIAMEEEGVEPPPAEGIDVFFVLEDDAPRDRSRVGWQSPPRRRRRGDRLRRPFAQGQLTQARRPGRVAHGRRRRPRGDLRERGGRRAGRPRRDRL